MRTGDGSEKDYSRLKVAQLRAELSRRDLVIKGNKAELVSRLEYNDLERAKADADADADGDADADAAKDSDGTDIGAPVSPRGGTTTEGGLALPPKGEREMTAEDEGDEVREWCNACMARTYMHGVHACMYVVAVTRLQ